MMTLTAKQDLGNATPASSVPTRLSPLHAVHQGLGAQFRSIAGWQVPQAYTAPEDEAAALARQVGVADVCSLGKLRVRGESAPELLAEAFGGVQVNPGYTAPLGLAKNAGLSLTGSYLARLTRDEFLIITPPGIEEAVAQYLEAERAAGGSFVTVIDQTSGNAGLAVAGPGSQAVLSKLCGLPFSSRDFANQRVAQSSLAGVHATIMRNDVGEMPAFELYFERPYAEYVWSCILDAGRESGIIPVGWGARELLQSNSPLP